MNSPPISASRCTVPYWRSPWCSDNTSFRENGRLQHNFCLLLCDTTLFKFVALHDTKYGNFSQTLTDHDLVNQRQVSWRGVGVWPGQTRVMTTLYLYNVVLEFQEGCSIGIHQPAIIPNVTSADEYDTGRWPSQKLYGGYRHRWKILAWCRGNIFSNTVLYTGRPCQVAADKNRRLWPCPSEREALHVRHVCKHNIEELLLWKCYRTTKHSQGAAHDNIGIAEIPMPRTSLQKQIHREELELRALRNTPRVVWAEVPRTFLACDENEFFQCIRMID